MKSKIGLITIGQAPRTDITPDLKEIWHDKLEIIEAGLLDDLTPEQIEELKPSREETILVSRLRDGTSVTLAEERIMPLMQEKISLLEKQVELIALMCTGEFSLLQAQVPVIQPDSILRNTVKGILKPGQKLGIFVPQEEQKKAMISIWTSYLAKLQVEIISEAASPYGEMQDIMDTADKFTEVNLIVLDCMGYNKIMKERIKEITSKPVVLPRTLIARIISELLCI